MDNKIIDQLSKQWEEFKETNDARLDEIKTCGDEATSETIEKLERIEKAHDLALENRKRLEAIEANAKIMQRSENGASDVDLKHRDAWYAAMACKKDDNRWFGLQQAMFDARKDVTLSGTGGGNAIPTLGSRQSHARPFRPRRTASQPPSGRELSVRSRRLLSSNSRKR